MKKIIAILALFGAASLFAADSYLYWMVNVENDDGVEWTSARVAWKNNENTSYLTSLYVDETSIGTTVGKGIIDSYADSGWGFYAALAADPSSGKYFIEILNGSEVIGSSDDGGISYTAAYIAQSGIGTPAKELWTSTVTLTAEVPEPSSGLLMLIGCAVLGLRRKKQQKKA